MKIQLALLSLLGLAGSLHAAKTLDIYFVDVEGGQATLIVTPSGQSMLVDTGWPGFSMRDANRIAAAAKKAGVKKIDYVVVTHYHDDHVGGVAQIAAKLPVLHFVDHGAIVETGKGPDRLWAAYAKTFQSSERIIAKVGDEIPLKGVDVKVVTSNGEVLPGGGKPNAFCQGAVKKEADPSENARSLGTLLTFGKFRFVDLGDLTWNKELELACPDNKIGTVDVYLTTHHGSELSGPPALVHALHPRVAIMNCGARKGGDPSAWDVVKSSPGLEDLWQVHFAVAGGKDHNAADTFIANVDEQCEGKYIKLSAEADGSFTVTNSRNNYSKTYAAR